MIGQHIYSRCLEGYFSKSGLNADSTTVTISMNMFARMEQAKLVAKECEKISTLEDIRPVPQEAVKAEILHMEAVISLQEMIRNISWNHRNMY